jgi:hypothetical protein
MSIDALKNLAEITLEMSVKNSVDLHWTIETNGLRCTARRKHMTIDHIVPWAKMHNATDLKSFLEIEIDLFASHANSEISKFELVPHKVVSGTIQKTGIVH